MAALARFTFDLDLAERPRQSAQAAAEPEPIFVPEPIGVPEEVVAQLVAQAREEGHSEGLKAGERNAASMASQTIAAAAGTLAAHTARMTTSLDEAIAMHRREAISLAASVGRKLATHLIEAQPTAELRALIAECMPSISGVPHLVIRCHPDLADSLRDIAAEQITSSGFAGRLVVMGDPDIRLGDGRLEWVDGGLVRDSDALATEIDKQISDYLAALGGPNTIEKGDQ
ncbi:FliH/SctL family protein [Devosia sp. FJ2-5-3]|uniref:FliH/SctL family protein n=1 Tax=Devosia sp. FJ2-5-3 TaxID=2976680 RepID=UPI0023D7FE5C|nr:FliH/SctL family protein [Devosia sp. FJ2-5-3]WEJ57961.1 FliH/SctL family protein [Devosia sp. FJ2-5-3]